MFLLFVLFLMVVYSWCLEWYVVAHQWIFFSQMHRSTSKLLCDCCMPQKCWQQGVHTRHLEKIQSNPGVDWVNPVVSVLVSPVFMHISVGLILSNPLPSLNFNHLVSLQWIKYKQIPNESVKFRKNKSLLEQITPRGQMMQVYSDAYNLILHVHNWKGKTCDIL